MSYPEDGVSREELKGLALSIAHHHAENLFDSSHRRENQEDEARAEAAQEDAPSLMRLSRTCLRNIASETSKRFLASDLTAVEAMSMGGETQYDVGKMHVLLKSMVDEVYGEMKSEGKLQEQTVELFQADVYTDRGRRAHMEDRHALIEDYNAYLGISDQDMPRQALFGVFDGHGGVDAAKFVEAQLPLLVGEHPAFRDDPRQALVEGFLATDTEFLKKAEREAYNSGATACVVLIRGTKLYVAWLGDSQVMMCRAGSTVQLMDPHKPNREDEKKRIEDSGGVVVWYGAWRVNGVLSVARAIGDRKLKQWVIGQPDVAEFDLVGDEEYLVLGCDGLWDVLTPEKVIALIAEWKSKAENVGVNGLAKFLVTQCLEDPSSSDNISIIVVALPKP